MECGISLTQCPRDRTGPHLVVIRPASLTIMLLFKGWRDVGVAPFILALLTGSFSGASEATLIFVFDIASAAVNFHTLDK